MFSISFPLSDFFILYFFIFPKIWGFCEEIELSTYVLITKLARDKEFLWLCSIEIFEWKLSAEEEDCYLYRCENGYKCRKINGKSECNCSGYSGSFCQSINCSSQYKKCKSRFCSIESFSILQPSDFYKENCKCNQDRYGRHCQYNQPLNQCISNPCQNGGTCHTSSDRDWPRGVRCICQWGTRGDFCEVNDNDCLKNPCLNNGTCIDMVNDFLCTCPQGFTGKTCQDSIDFCQFHSCSNSAICYNGPSSHVCHCSKGYNGTNCDMVVNTCSWSSHLCLNGGTCVPGVGNFSCRCKQGYAGSHCQLTQKVCHKTYCLNDGTCNEVRLNNSLPNPFCACKVGYSGSKCEIKLKSCELPSPCLNGGTCRPKISSYDYFCDCPQAFQGRNCEKKFTIGQCSSCPCMNNVKKEFI